MIRVHCGNLVTVNDSYGPPYPNMECGNLVTVNDLWSPIPYMGCRNLVTVNYSYGPPLPYMEQVSYGPPTHVRYHFSGQLIERGPLRVLINSRRNISMDSW